MIGKIIRGAVGMLAVVVGASAFAQPYPSKPIRMISPFPVGGPVDAVFRQFGQEITNATGQAWITENRPGGNGVISLDGCARGVPDGYTICLVDRTSSMLPHLYNKLPFDVNKDFEPITNVVFTILALVVHPSMGVKDFKELLAIGKSKPGAYNYASMGAGTTANLLMEWLRKQNGVELTHVPFKGPPPLLQSLMGGETHLTYLGLGSFPQLHQAGKLRIIGISGNRRSPVVPDVPTLTEQGLTGIDTRVWFGLFGPAGLPREARDRIQREIARISAIPSFREKNIIGQAFEPIADTPEEFAKFLRADRESAAELIRVTGIRLE